MIEGWSQLSLAETALSKPSATMKTSSPCSTATYSSAGLNAIPRFAGSVQGVVVQMTILTLRLARPGSTFTASGNGNFTYTDGLVWSSYSTSASARAVWSKIHQWTGRI